MTPNTIFECIKNEILLSNPKLVFLTEFNLNILHLNVRFGQFFIPPSVPLPLLLPSPPATFPGYELLAGTVRSPAAGDQVQHLLGHSHFLGHGISRYIYVIDKSNIESDVRR